MVCQRCWGRRCPGIKARRGRKSGGEGFAFLNRVGDVTLLPGISASPMKLGHQKGRGQRKPRRQQHLNIFRCVWFEGLVSCVFYTRIVFTPLLIHMVWKRSFGGRVAFAVNCCGHSFGRKDADRPVVFWNHVQLYHQPHFLDFFFFKKARKCFCISLDNIVCMLSVTECPHRSLFYFLFLFFNVSVYLAVPGLSCNMWDL